jgi:TP53 regulating kinase-like protein
LTDKKLVKKGAEASLFLEEWQGTKVIMKRRLPKKYRLPAVDEKIRSHRTVHEANLLHWAKEAGVPTPAILMVDLAHCNIVMEFVEGKQVKEVLDDLLCEERRSLSRQIGEFIGRLHRNDIVHGDLTTSNMVLTPDRRIVFVDFGLGERAIEVEPKGVDLHLMKRAFQSVHFRYAEECFNFVLRGYADVVGERQKDEVVAKIGAIEKRGRYVSERRRVARKQ